MSGPRWCACKRLRGDVFSDEGRHERCGQLTQGGPAGATPINVAAALRDDARTGVGTPGDGIGEPGDPSPTLSVSGATPAVFYAKTHSPTGPDDAELWVEASVARTVTGAEAHRPNQAVYVKVHNAQTSTDYESWTGAEVSRTLNCFDVGDTRAAVITITEEERMPDSKVSKVSIPEPPLAECGCCPADPKPDSSRYRACGNAVTVNVAEWIGRRLLPVV